MEREVMAEGNQQGPEAEQPQEPRISYRDRRASALPEGAPASQPDVTQAEVARRLGEAARASKGPVEPREGETTPREDRGLPDETLEELDRTIGLIGALGRAREELIASSEEMRRLSETDPEAFRAQVRTRAAQLVSEQRIYGDLVRGPGMAGRRRESRPGEESITVRTEFGYREAFVPEDDQRKVEWMRKILNDVEKTKFPTGDDVTKFDLIELALVISALRKWDEEITDDLPEEEKVRKRAEENRRRSLGERMYAEFQARLHLHNAYLQFEKAGDLETIDGIVSSFTADHLNFLFRESASHGLYIWRGIVYLEQNATKVLKSRGDQIRLWERELEASIVRQEGSTISVESTVGARVTARRLWEMTGRSAIRDDLVKKETKTKPRQEDKEKGEVVFMGETNNGTFVMRRLIQFKQFIFAQISTYPEFKWYLLGGKKKSLDRAVTKGDDGKFRIDYPDINFIDVDLGTEDFFKSLPETLVTYYETILFEKYVNNPDETIDIGEGHLTEVIRINDRAEFVLAKAKENAFRVVQIQTGIPLEEDKVDPITKRMRYKWSDREDPVDPNSRRLGYYDLTRVKWGVEGLKDAEKDELRTILGEIPVIDFNRFGSNPMNLWGFRKLSLPDKIREALITNPDSFLRKPTYESLKKLASVLQYLGGSYDETKGNFLANLVLYERYFIKELRGFNYNLAEVDGEIHRALADNFVTKGNSQKAKEALWDSIPMPYLKKLKGKALVFEFFNPLLFVIAAVVDAIRRGFAGK